MRCIRVKILEAGVKTIDMDAQKPLAWLKKALESKRSPEFREELQEDRLPSYFLVWCHVSIVKATHEQREM